MAGSAYRKGRIEFIIMRHLNTQDGLGIDEPMIDWSSDNKGLNFTSTFRLAWTSNRTDLYQMI